MKVLPSLAGLSEVPGPVCLAIGVFDGVHLGHRVLIERCRAEAEKIGGSAVVLTFDPHPVKVLRPQQAPRLLTSTPHKLRLIADLGCSYLLLQRFDAEFAAWPAGDFLTALAQAARPLQRICVGWNWAFGRNRSGNVALLREVGKREGFETLEIEPVTAAGEAVSSTRIRQAVEQGDLDTARRFLGRPYSVLGTVRAGARLGRQLGFPTANLAAHNEQFPPDGVYAVRVQWRGDWHEGVANIGVRPTVESAGERLLEVHVFEAGGDFYNEDLEVVFETLLRLEKKFPDLAALQSQIAADAAEARRILAARNSR